jgi:hypothetical protein
LEFEDANRLRHVVFGDDEVLLRETGDVLSVLVLHNDGLHNQLRVDFKREGLALLLQRLLLRLRLLLRTGNQRKSQRQ